MVWECCGWLGSGAGVGQWHCGLGMAVREVARQTEARARERAAGEDGEVGVGAAAD